jgi:hypothetical protein
LREQVRASNAAEASVDIALLQFIISALGLIAVCITLVLNGRAVIAASQQVVVAEKAASDALLAAREANAISRSSLQAPYKPRLDILPSGPVASSQDIRDHNPAAPMTIMVRVLLKVLNHGPGAAIVRTCWCACEGRHFLNEQIMGWKLPADEESILAPPWKRNMDVRARDEPHPASVSVGYVQAQSTLAGTPIPPFVTVIFYEDMIGNEWVASFGFEGTSLRNPDFRRWGGDKYNFHGRLDDPTTPIGNLNGPIRFNP